MQNFAFEQAGQAFNHCIVQSDRLKQYLSKNYGQKPQEDYIVKAWAFYSRYLQRQGARDR